MLEVNHYRDNSVPLSCFEHKDTSSPSKLNLLLIHGAGATKVTWNPIMPQLKEKYNIYAIDLRGHGDSPIGNEDLSIDQNIADIERFMEEKGLKKVVVVAHSMGVRIGVSYAKKNPEHVQALVLEDLHVLARPIEEVKEEEVARRKQFKAYHDTLEEAKQEVLKYSTEEKFQSWLKDGRVKMVDGKYFIGVNPYVEHLAMNMISGSNQTKKSFKLIDGQKTPILLLKAEKLSFVSEEGLKVMQKMQPLMKYAFIPNSEHSIHKTAPAAFLQNLDDFLSGV